MRVFLAAALLALTVAACDDDSADPSQTVAIPEADVERFRAEIVQRTFDLDADLAALEAEAAAADSVAQAGYAPVLDRLRADRRRLQVRLDSLRPAPRARFDSTAASVRAQTDRLAAALRGARYDAAPTFAALQAAAGRGLARIDARIAALRTPDAPADRLRALDALADARAQLAARLGAYPDTSAAAFPPFRQSVAEAVLALERRAEALASDTTRAVAPDSTAAP